MLKVGKEIMDADCFQQRTNKPKKQTSREHTQNIMATVCANGCWLSWRWNLEALILESALINYDVYATKPLGILRDSFCSCRHCCAASQLVCLLWNTVFIKGSLIFDFWTNEVIFTAKISYAASQTFRGKRARRTFVIFAIVRGACP